MAEHEPAARRALIALARVRRIVPGRAERALRGLVGGAVIGALLPFEHWKRLKLR